MKIVFVTKTMALAGGGAERVISQVAPELAARGHDVTICTRDPTDSSDFYDFRGVSRKRYGGCDFARPSSLAGIFKWMTVLRRDFIAERPDVVIGVMHSSYLPLGAALVGTGIPVIASEHTVYSHYQGRARERLALELTPCISAKITVVSQTALESFPTRLRRRMSVLTNPVVGAPKQHSDTARELVILSVGRLDEAKDHATLIEAFALIASSFPAWRLQIAGSGPLRGSLEDRVLELGLSDKVTLLGAVRDVAPLYSRCSIFATASRYESFGLSVAEAMIHGLPVVAFSDCPGVNELVKEGWNGLLLSGLPDRISSLSQALACLIANPGTRDRLAINAARSVSNFGLTPVVDEWERLLQKTASGC